MTKRVLILVEGQTEERFVSDVLAPDFWAAQELKINATILNTKKVKDGPNFKGGVTSFKKFDNDMRRLLKDSGALVTTFIDYYALPADFPGMQTRAQKATGAHAVKHVEAALRHHYSSAKNFQPFLALHEFEALLFSDVNVLPEVMNSSNKQAAFSAIRAGFASPEDINNGTETAPSKRIIDLFPSYNKTVHGLIVAKKIGLPAIRLVCPHFSEWLSKLEDFAISG